MGMGKRIFSRKRGVEVYRINGIKVPLTSTLDASVIAKKLGIRQNDIKSFIILNL